VLIISGSWRSWRLPRSWCMRWHAMIFR
jgi:hypothetical protein